MCQILARSLDWFDLYVCVILWVSLWDFDWLWIWLMFILLTRNCQIVNYFSKQLDSDRLLALLVPLKDTKDASSKITTLWKIPRNKIRTNIYWEVIGKTELCESIMNSSFRPRFTFNTISFLLNSLNTYKLLNREIVANLRTYRNLHDISSFIRFISMHNNNRYAFIRIP